MTLNQPLFSLLMANYNNADYIDNSINSVINQTYQNWEIIIVDDYSTDTSKEVYKKYADNKQIKIYFNDINRGYGYTLDRCAKLAEGKYYGILDPDDELSDNRAIATMIKYHEESPDAGLICSRHNICNKDMVLLWTSGIRDKDRNLVYLTDRQYNTEHFITIKAEIYKQCPIDIDYRNAVDQEFFYRIEEISKILFVDDILYNYRYISTGISHQGYKALYWHSKAIMEACERRQIDPEKVIEKLFIQIVTPHEEKYQRLLNSKYYKLGKILLDPLYKIKSILSRKN